MMELGSQGHRHPNKFDIPGHCKPVIVDETENCIELLIVTGSAACDELTAIAGKPS